MTGWAEDEMVQGYLDGRDPNSPAPSANRSRSYRHGFQSGLDDRAWKPSAPFAVRMKQADEALAADTADAVGDRPDDATDAPLS